MADQSDSNPLISNERLKRSASIGKLASALAKAQGEIENAVKDTKGNYGKYATLASTWDAIRGALSKNEIAVYQRPLTINGKLTMCTMLIHSSGEFLDDGELEMIFDRTGGRITPMQAMGSAVTYARRYTLQAAVGVAPADDDDGQGAGQNVSKPQAPPAEKKSEPPPPPPPQQQKKKVNTQPANEELMQKIYNASMDRAVQESELLHLVNKGYGVDNNTAIPTWIAEEILALLEHPDTNSGTIMAESVRVQNRREAARRAQQQGG